jgi:tripartite-type tricarboxylate transporter receptor subunit TctC
MNIRLNRPLLAFALALGLGLVTLAPHGSVHAQAFPNKPVRLLVGVSPGGGLDLASRVVAAKLGELWGQPLLVENRAGAGQMIAVEAVAKAAPDGYTLLACTTGTHAIGPALFNKTSVDHIKDFAPISLFGTNPIVLVANSEVPASSIKDFVAYANAHPGKVAIAYGGIGTPPHLTTEMFRLVTGINSVLTPYKGGSAALADLLGGHVQAQFDGLSTQLTTIKAGKVRALAVTSLKRNANLPDTPTMIEAGFPIDVTAWYGICAPAGVPKPILDKLHADMVKALNSPDVRQRLEELGLDVETQTPEQFAALIKSETAKWAKVVKDARIPLQ